MTSGYDYRIEFLHQIFYQEPESGLQTWSAVFDQWREAWQIADCQRLLRELKGVSLSPQLRPVVLMSTYRALNLQRARLEQYDVMWKAVVATISIACELGGRALAKRIYDELDITERFLTNSVSKLLRQVYSEISIC